MNRTPIPAIHEVHIRFTHLDRGPAELARMESFLTPDERARADRLRDKVIRDRFVAARGFLRATLAAYLELRPEGIRLGEGEWGKPCLAEGAGYVALTFNLSHAANLAVLAVARGCEVGIDLEKIVEGAPLREMARLFFSSRERDELFGLPPEEQPAAFYRCWTRKEAYLKGNGKGFLLPSDSFDVSLLPGDHPALLNHRASRDDPAAWSLTDIPAPPEFCATLAVKGEHPRIKIWD